MIADGGGLFSREGESPHRGNAAWDTPRFTFLHFHQGRRLLGVLELTGASWIPRIVVIPVIPLATREAQPQQTQSEKSKSGVGGEAIQHGGKYGFVVDNTIGVTVIGGINGKP